MLRRGADQPQVTSQERGGVLSPHLCYSVVVTWSCWVFFFPRGGISHANQLPSSSNFYFSNEITLEVYCHFIITPIYHQEEALTKGFAWLHWPMYDSSQTDIFSSF